MSKDHISTEEYLGNIPCDSIDDNIAGVNEVLGELRSESLTLAAISAQFNFLLGETLTIVDASFQDLVQRKAVKDLVKGKFYDRMEWVAELVGKGRHSGSVGTSKNV